MKHIPVILILALGVTARADVLPNGARPPAPPRKSGGWFGIGGELPRGALLRLGAPDRRGCTGPAAFSPDGHLIAAATENGFVVLDARTGRALRRFRANGHVSGLSFSPDGRHILPAVDAQPTPVWDVETGEVVRTVHGMLATYTEGGRKAVYQVNSATTNPLTYRVLDLAADKVGERVELTDVTHHRAYCPGGPIVAVQDLHGLRVISLTGGKDLLEIPSPDANEMAAAFSPDGKRLAVKMAPGRIEIWDIDAAKRIHSIKHRCDSDITFSPDGRQIAFSAFDADGDGIGYAWVCDVKEGKPRKVGGPTNMLRNWHAFSPDGTKLAFLDEGNVLVVRDVWTGKDVWPTDGHTGHVGRVHFTPDDRHLVSRDKNTILVWERTTGKLVRRYPADLPNGERPVIDTLAADRIVTVAGDGTLRLRDLVTGKQLRTLDGKHGFVFGAAAPADVAIAAKVVALQGRDYNIRAYDLTTGRIVLDFEPPCAVWDVRLSPDGRFIAWASQNHPKGDGNRYLEIAGGKELTRDRLPAGTFPLADERGRPGPQDIDMMSRVRELNYLPDADKLLFDGVQRSPLSLYLSRDGRRVAVRLEKRPADALAVGPSEFRVYERTGGRRFPAFVPKPQRAEAACFSPDGRLFATADMAGQIQVWELATGQRRAEFRGDREATAGVLTFSTDGRTLASGGADGLVYLWDLTGRGAAARRTTDLRELYGRLIDSDAEKAGRAIHELAADPEGSVKLLAEQIRPVAAPDAKEVARLIADLDDPSYAVRQRANAGLAKRGELILMALKNAEKKPISQEQAERLRKLIGALERPEVSGEALRAVRAVEAVERIGAPAAKELLTRWASGAADATLTREAKWALGRSR